MDQKQQWKWEKIVLASHNSHKLSEFRSLFKQQFGLEVSGLDSYGNFPEVVEDGETFEANAIKKARAVADVVKLPVIADDSGLAVDALDGAPGIYSARYAGVHGDDEANNRKLLTELRDVPVEKRGATFVCVLAMYLPDQDPIIVRGECPGRIVFAPRGTHGFGYDPIFELQDCSVTMAELSPEDKGRVSHRARAMQALAERLQIQFLF